jgi:hypothetical protein
MWRWGAPLPASKTLQKGRGRQAGWQRRVCWLWVRLGPGPWPVGRRERSPGKPTASSSQPAAHSQQLTASSPQPTPPSPSPPLPPSDGAHNAATARCQSKRCTGSVAPSLAASFRACYYGTGGNSSKTGSSIFYASEGVPPMNLKCPPAALPSLFCTVIVESQYGDDISNSRS